MPRATPVLAVLGLLVGAPALADVPPPPYHGATHATLAGLDFERADGRLPVDPSARPGPYRRAFKITRLTACHGASRNCTQVTRAGVIGWGVSKVDGQWVAYGDIGALDRLLSASRRAVKVTFTRIDGVASGELEVTLSPR